MPLKRTNVEIKPAVPAVTAAYGEVKSLLIDYANQSATVAVKWGNKDASGNVAGISEESFTIQDKPVGTATKEETLTVTAGKVTLAKDGATNVRVKTAGTLLSQASTLNGKVLTIVDIADGTQVIVNYDYPTPAKTTFSNIAKAKPDATKTFFENIAVAVWGTLLSEGLVSGTMETVAPK